MQTLQLSKQTAIKRFKEATPLEKDMLIDTFGAELFSGKITDRVKTFSDALEIVGASENVSTLLSYNGIDPDMISAVAFIKLTIIAKALNENWKPDWTNSNEYKYYPWFRLSSGFDFGGSGYYYVAAAATVGFRLCFKSEELSNYAGSQFTEIYKEFLTLNK